MNKKKDRYKFCSVLGRLIGFDERLLRRYFTSFSVMSRRLVWLPRQHPAATALDWRDASLV